MRNKHQSPVLSVDLLMFLGKRERYSVVFDNLKMTMQGLFQNYWHIDMVSERQGFFVVLILREISWAVVCVSH